MWYGWTALPRWIMSDKNTPPVIGETLSALMDDEVEQLELRRVLKNLSDDPELRAKWSRLHLISFPQ